MPCKQKRKKKDKFGKDHEPMMDLDGFVECGGELIYAVDETPAGFPIGLSYRELKERQEHEAYTNQRGWARTKHILCELFTEVSGEYGFELGRVSKTGQGLFREAYAAYIDVFGNKDSSGSYVVLLPRRNAEEKARASWINEANLLRALQQYSLPFTTPELICTYESTDGLILVERFQEGIPLDLRAGRQSGIRPWKEVGLIAAAIHSLPVGILSQFPSAPRTCLEFGTKLLEPLCTAPEPEIQEACAWCKAHLPPDEPVVLVHGDLLGQNILVPISHGEKPGVIDWTLACAGDPAYELSIVTRGVRKPFQMTDGMQRLIDAYQQFGGKLLSPQRIHFYEVVLFAQWYLDTPRDIANSGLRETRRTALCSLLRRVVL